MLNNAFNVSSPIETFLIIRELANKKTSAGVCAMSFVISLLESMSRP